MLVVWDMEHVLQLRSPPMNSLYVKTNQNTTWSRHLGSPRRKWANRPITKTCEAVSWKIDDPEALSNRKMATL
jgi:hypothetical protein